ncbi:MAG: LacI family DNA-binding transcriptional regulator [Propionibacterium sp.]|nr:LacI family DNA-binding transcriptional regulator [Propionibacterium sp.]
MSERSGTPTGHGSVTIYDVAREAGVSVSTVSRAFSRPGRVSAETARLVHEVASRLGYRSQAIYRTPRATKTGMLGLLVSDVTNPFYFGIIRGAELAAHRAGVSITLVDSQESRSLERRLVEHTLPTVDGLIVASSRVSDTDLRAVGKQVPIVILNRHVSGLPCVLPDTRSGMQQAVDHLVGLGHRRMAYLAGPPTSWADGQRWRTFRDACLGLGIANHRCGPVSPTVRGGEDAADEVLRDPVTAVVAYNDLVAIGLMRALIRRGVRVPADISVVGFDNTFASDLVTPGLTTVAAPLTALGEQAVRAVLHPTDPTSRTSDAPVSLPVRLVVRASTGPAASLRA